MTKEELEKEIEFIHDNRINKRLLRPLDVMQKTICEASNTYTNISLFMNDLYLLALLHTCCKDD